MNIITKKPRPADSVTPLNAMIARQGGGLTFTKKTTYNPQHPSYVNGTHFPQGYKPFTIAIHNPDTKKDSVVLTLIVNPKDIQIGQVHIANNSYTRKGWVSTLWGMQQQTITANGSSPGFYYNKKMDGLVNANRINTWGFLNLQSLMAIYRNNGHYHLKRPSEQTFFKDGTSRVIHVMDVIKITYDENEYTGSFNTFSLDETAEMPYRLEYTFEFIVSGLKGDTVEGHVRRNDNEKNPDIIIDIQDSDSTFNEIIQSDTETLAEGYKLAQKGMPNENPQNYDWSNNQNREEVGYYDRPENSSSIATVPANTVVVARGGRDKSPHDMFLDFRTASHKIYSLTNGEVFLNVHMGYDKGCMNYYLIKSEIDFGGKIKTVLVQYYHLEPRAPHWVELKKGATVKIGDVIGYEGTDFGQYPPHCHLALKFYDSYANSGSWLNAKKYDAGYVFYRGIVSMNQMGIDDFKYVWHKHNDNKPERITSDIITV